MLSTDHPVGSNSGASAPQRPSCAHTDHTTAVGGGHDGSFLISHQQNASQGEASRGVLSIRSLHTNKRSKGIRPAAGGSLLHLLSRRQRGQANRRGLNR